MTNDLRIGSLFSGYGGLDMGAQQVIGGDVAWHVEYDAAPSKILAHHWPTVPNYGDVTAVDWSQVAPVDILTGGFPCQDVSSAGLRRGLKDGTRSGLWSEFAKAIDALRPQLVVIENVRGLLNAEATRGLEPDAWGLGNSNARPPLRALGAVLGDLADLGYDAEWCGLRAADAGAPHGRFRVFVLAYPACDTSSAAWGGQEQQHLPATVGSAAEPREPACETAGWGPYAPAVGRWERVTGRPAPAPSLPVDGKDGASSINPLFLEWMMGLPEGHVTNPAIGLTPDEQRKAAGNGVVPQQAALAIRSLLAAGAPAPRDPVHA